MDTAQVGHGDESVHLRGSAAPAPVPTSVADTESARSPTHDVYWDIGQRALHRADVLTLQRKVGNQRVTHLLRRQLAQRDDTTRTAISETTDTGNKYTQDLLLNKKSARITITLGVKWVKKGTWADRASGGRRRIGPPGGASVDPKYRR
jgi:hypothetical protein